ncbi:MFS transporter [Acidaminobacter hydrogenoformans]|uniref:MFS transporter, FSR family, fosmidomycin resistance protein n=1 Tax=Acidaminobacter hydrogenoformans DSM 2784 TaxID=1120920 RepID=A0A1G5S124_9FIRM|nr:MFS transporter [Acidaminobacter hydrogenoformans]SCZ79827.1 MFS transporter, FSR family, fosmidomycin resistance protein [Acidaminobacter hydrogenoformans DSM 2784]
MINETAESRIASKGYFTKLIAVSVGHFFNDFYMNLVPPILFMFVAAMGLTLAQQAFIAFVITSSGSFAQPFIGYVVDKKGKPWLLTLSMIWIAFWMSISGVISNYYLLVFVVGIGALASALYHPLGSAMAVKLAKNSRGRSLSVFMTIGGFAASVAPVVAIPIVERFGLKSLIFFIVPGLVTAFFMHLARIHTVALNPPESGAASPSEKLELRAVRWLSFLVYISSSRVLVRSFLVTFGVQIMLLGQWDVKIAGAVLSGYLFANSFGTIIGGVANDAMGSKKALILFNGLSILCMAAIVLSSGTLMLAGFVVMGIALGGSNTANVVMAHELLPRNINMATGLIMGMSGGIGGLMMLLFGKLSDLQGLLMSSTYILVPLALSVLAALLLPEKRMPAEGQSNPQ